MFSIKSIAFRKILNSHADFTREFIVELADGSTGMAGSPQGETISIYEDKKISIDPEGIIKKLREDSCVGKPVNQEILDKYLWNNLPIFGRNNAYSLSLAFLRATEKTMSVFESFNMQQPKKLSPPRICCNILNGGWHAYTNPVLSDFPEYLLVARSSDIGNVIEDHNEIQRVVREKFLTQSKAIAGKNPVNRFATKDNRECIDFLLKILDSLELSDKFDLMIDASGSDLWNGSEYSFPLTDNSVWSSEEFCEYWLNLIKQYNIAFIEDPFHEMEAGKWHDLTTSQSDCKVIGDNFYSSDAGRIAEGAAHHYSHGVIIKPNQSGTVTAVRQAIETAKRNGLFIITSHRSISTEDTFISTLTCLYEIPYIKIGPLISDYSSVMRLNEIIRLAG
jgi:enolase